MRALSGVLALLFIIDASSTSDFAHLRTVNQKDVDTDLVKEMDNSEHHAKRLEDIVAELQVIFEALPKDASGHLNHATTFYALHRLFNRRHGWFIKGLEPDVFKERNASAGDDGLKDYMKGWVPNYLMQRLETLRPSVQRDGVSLHDLASLAATVEDLIREESDVRLSAIYEALGHSTKDILTKEQLEQVMDTYMYVVFCRGNILYNSTEHLKQKTTRYFTVKYKEYPKLSEWLRNIEAPFEQVADNDVALNFSSMAAIAQKAGEDYAELNADDCVDMKSMFTDLEERSGKVGRVRLPDFYNKSLYSRWKLNERVEYLRALGALDESNPKMTYILTANYLNARSNCLEASSIHAICCRNECEDLMTKIETDIGEPTAAPDQIAQMVSGLESQSVAAPRELSDALRERLGQAAAANGGRVHLHGRLFAQWMHHAYPRECPYPHEAGTISPQDPSEWLQQSGHDTHTLSDAELESLVAEDQCSASGPCDQDGDAELPWSHVEELLSAHSQHRVDTSEGIGIWLVVKLLTFGLLLGTMARVVFRTLSKAKHLNLTKEQVIGITALSVFVGICIASWDQTIFVFMMLGVCGQEMLGAKQVRLHHKKIDDCDDPLDRINASV